MEWSRRSPTSRRRPKPRRDRVGTSPPSHLLAASATRWLEEQEIASHPAQLRLPFDLRYGDVVLPQYAGQQPALRWQSTSDFTARVDNAGNTQLFLTPHNAAALLHAADDWFPPVPERPLRELDGTESAEVVNAALRVAGLWQHSPTEAWSLWNDASLILLAESPHAHTLMRLLLRADRITAATRADSIRRIAAATGTIYHRERITSAPDAQRHAWLRLLRLGYAVLLL